MKVLPRLLSGVVLLAGSAAFAQSSATVSNIPATARIYKPITLALTNTGLSFGDIFADATGGDVTLNPQTGARSTTGPVLATTGVSNAAVLTVGGKRNATYSIALPANSTITLTSPGGTPIPVNNFFASVGGGAPANPATGLIPNVAAGTQSFAVGATITLGANQMDGDYAGTFNVTVTYN
jgi:hypothetical protein